MAEMVTAADQFPDAGSEATAAGPEPAAVEPPKKETVTYRICFVPSRDIFSGGSDPLKLLSELKELGSCNVVAHTAGFPALEQMNPEECYIYWDVILTTDQGVNAIREVFIFVEDDCKLRIESSPGPQPGEGAGRPDPLHSA